MSLSKPGVEASNSTPAGLQVGKDYPNKAQQLRNLWSRNASCAGLDQNLEYAYSLELNPLFTNPQPDGERYFYHSDHLGSSAYITTENGYATQFLAYMPYGETLSEQQNSTSYYSPFKFSAKEKDGETGYSYFGARYYSPELSVWLGIDPLSDKYPSLSPYNYCALNPIMLVDPDGRQFDDYFDKEGNFLFRDNKTTDNVRIIDRKDWEQIQSEFGKEILDAGTTHKNLDQALEAKSTAIEDTKLSGHAVRKIFNNIIARMPEMDVSKLHNRSVSTYDMFNPKNTTNNGHATGEASTLITPQGKIRISVLMTGGLIPKEFNTISNIQNAIGVHEYLGHGILGYSDVTYTHYKAYQLQMRHRSWNNTTDYFRSSMDERYKTYLNPPR